MTYYPVGIPTLCRYEHFRRCVESLRNNTHANKTELVVGLDYPPSDKYKDGYEKISKYVDTIDGFAKVTVFRHKENLGAVGNWAYVQNYIFQNYDAAIMSEDDNEFAPCFLDYMNKCLERYKNDSSVESITGFKFVNFHFSKKYDVFKTCISFAWGLGLWREKESKNVYYTVVSYKEKLHQWNFFFKTMKVYPNLIPLLIAMVKADAIWGDVCRAYNNIENKTYQIAPTTSLVRNWGYDGSGEHCGKLTGKGLEDTLPELPGISNYSINNVAPIGSLNIKIGQFKGLYGCSLAHALYRYAKVFYLYAKYRIMG